MTAKRRRRQSGKGNDSGGVISTPHRAGWLLLGAGLLYAVQEDFLPTDTTSHLAAMAAVVMGVLYLTTLGVQLFKLIQQKWTWCNEVFAGISALFGAMLFATLCWIALAHALPSAHARATGQALGITIEAGLDDRYRYRRCRPRLVGAMLDAGLFGYVCLPRQLRDSTQEQFTLHGLQTDWGFLVLRASEAPWSPEGQPRGGGTASVARPG